MLDIGRSRERSMVLSSDSWALSLSLSLFLDRSIEMSPVKSFAGSETTLPILGIRATFSCSHFLFSLSLSQADENNSSNHGPLRSFFFLVDFIELSLWS